MRISDVYQNYSRVFQNISTYKKNDITINALAVGVLKIAVVILLGCAAIYGIASLCRRVSKKQDPSTTAQAEIISEGWGTITLRAGVTKIFKDVIILPSKEQPFQEWNWQAEKPFMRHHPGIRIIDIENLIFKHTPTPDVIILSQGRGHGGQRDNPGPGILEVCAGVKEHIESQGVEVHILKTAAAIEKYNELRNEGKKHIAALIHTTC